MLDEKYKLFKNLVGTSLLEKSYYKIDFSIITCKSLIPSKKDLSVRINYERFSKEVDLWKYYKRDSNEALKNIKKTYWTDLDDSIFSRLIVIFIVNDNFDNIEDEVIKNILFTTGNISLLFENLLIIYAIYAYFKRLDIDTFLKDKIINFNQLDFLSKYEVFFRESINTCPTNYRVEFEKEKITILNYLNKVDISSYSKFREIYSIVSGVRIEGTSLEGKVLESFILDREDQISEFYHNMAKFLELLRRGRVDYRSLEISKYILPNIFDLKKGEKFYHSLLNYGLVLDVTEDKSGKQVLIDTKSGKYLFKKNYKKSN